MAERKFFYGDGGQYNPVSANYLRVIPPQAVDAIGKIIQKSAVNRRLFSGGDYPPDPLQRSQSEEVVIIRPVTGREEAIVTELAPMNTTVSPTPIEDYSLSESPTGSLYEPVSIEDIRRGIEHESITQIFLPSLQVGSRIVLTTQDQASSERHQNQAVVRIIRPAVRDVINPISYTAPVAMIETNQEVISQLHGNISLLGTEFIPDTDYSPNLCIFQGFPMVFAGQTELLDHTPPLADIKIFGPDNSPLDSRKIFEALFVSDEEQGSVLGNIKTLYAHMLDVFQQPPDDVFRYHHIIDYVDREESATEEYKYGSLNNKDMLFLEQNKSNESPYGVVLYDSQTKKSYMISQTPPTILGEEMYRVYIAEHEQMQDDPSPKEVLDQHRNAKVFAVYNISNFKNIDDSRYVAINSSLYHGLLKDIWAYYCISPNFIGSSKLPELRISAPNNAHRIAHGIITRSLQFSIDRVYDQMIIFHKRNTTSPHVFPYDPPIDKIKQLFRKTNG